MPYFFKPNITDAEYKQEQVQFVSDNSGSNYTLLFCMFLTHVYLNYTHHLLHHYFPLLHKHFLIYLFSDLLISIPLVLFVLMYSSVTYYLFIIITIVGFVICYHYPQRNVPQTFPAVSVGFVEIRSLVNLWTLLAILAIDFTIYPREHTKSEFYGISLMDIGVGFVVMTSGIASGLKENTTPYLKNLKANCLQSLPIFAIGLLRLIGTIAVDYQHHMSEYGAHMNFFFVLGFVQILVALLKIPRKYALIGSIILICLYETCLQVFDLYTFVLSDDRSNIIYANKEGLLSVFGYTALNIASTALGYYYSLSNTKQYRIKLDFYVFLVSGVMVSIYAALYSFIPPCRPLINLSYLLSTLSIGFCCYAAADAVPMYLPIKQTAGSNGLSLNQLPLFLIANLATGIINQIIYTIHVPPFESIIIICIYIGILRSMAFILGYYHCAFKIQTMKFVVHASDNRTVLHSYSIPDLVKIMFGKKVEKKQKKVNEEQKEKEVKSD